MKLKSVSVTHQQTHAVATAQINRALSRFPLVVDTLEKLSASEIPMPGDADIRHGCERALTAMLSELAQIGRAANSEQRVDGLEIPAWNKPLARHLVDADKLERIQQFIDTILGAE